MNKITERVSEIEKVKQVKGFQILLTRGKVFWMVRNQHVNILPCEVVWILCQYGSLIDSVGEGHFGQ